jgi:hypothetical protein
MSFYIIMADAWKDFHGEGYKTCAPRSWSKVLLQMNTQLVLDKRRESMGGLTSSDCGAPATSCSLLVLEIRVSFRYLIMEHNLGCNT